MLFRSGFAAIAAAQSSSHPLTVAYKVQNIVSGITTTADGRVFTLYSHINNGPDAHVVELMKNGAPRLYPNEAWNNWKAGADPAKTFVAVNALRMGPDGLLWIVDTGGHGLGTPIEHGGAKLVTIDVHTNTVQRVYPLDAGVDRTSYVDDIRFHNHNAYLTDAGVPGIIVVDLDTGSARRVLDHDPSTTARHPLRASGHILMVDGKQLRVHADQLEVSPDGKWFYYQPACGPMYRIDTHYLDDPKISAVEIARNAHVWAQTPSTGGTVIDNDGNIYVSDLNKRAVYRYTPDGKRTLLVQDSRLDWIDAMWIDRQGNLWMPAAQIDQTPTFAGTSHVSFPVLLLTTPIEHPPQY